MTTYWAEELLVQGVLRAEILQSKEATVIKLSLGPHDFYGTAKRHPDDEHNPQLGRDLAYGRALREASRFYLRRARKEGENG